MCSYQHLKKIVYSLERAQYEANDTEAVEQGGNLESESETLLCREPSYLDRQFVPHLDKELRKIVDFYCMKEKELFDEVDATHEHVRMAEEDDYEGGGVESDVDASYEGAHIPIGGRDAEDSTGRLAPHRRASPAAVPTRRAHSLASIHDPDAHTQPSQDTLPVSRRWLHTFGRRGSFHKSSRRHHSPSASSFDTTNVESIDGHSERGFGGAGGRALSVWVSQDDYAIDMRLTIKRRLMELYTSLNELKGFAELNQTGMKKILKKYDKTTGSSLKDRYMEQVVKVKYPFQPQTSKLLEERVDELVHLYAHVATRDDVELAAQQLRMQLREEVVWHRNTVWREMINIERRAQAASLEKGLMGLTGGHLLNEQPELPRVIRTPFGSFVVPSFCTVGTLQLTASLVLFVALLKMPALRFFERIEVQNCFALLVLCTCLWVTEVVELFVTSLLVPFLIVTLRVAREGEGEGRRLTAPEASKWIFAQMFAPNVSLLLGGFTLAAALSKYGIDKVIATRVLQYAGTRPSVVLLAHMLVACFASMWISNVAAPVLMFSLVQPILRNLPPKSPYATSMVMGIALASNIGGQTSPIASPQNLIALQYMDKPLGWVQWFAITIPVSGTSLLVLWLLLLWSFGTGSGVHIKRIPETDNSFSRAQWFISAVCLGTIVLWCFQNQIQGMVGDMAVTAIIPLVLFFGTGVLTKEDFNNFLWTIVFLAMGGIALGKAVASSGLLKSLDSFVQDEVNGLPLWGILAILVGVGLVVATFISHTIAAVLLVPIAAQMGANLVEPHPRLLIMATTLTSSAAMGLPISGFPNMTAINLEDEVGHHYVSVKTFLRVGIPASVLATIIIATLGYVIMLLLGL